MINCYCFIFLKEITENFYCVSNFNKNGWFFRDKIALLLLNINEQGERFWKYEVMQLSRMLSLSQSDWQDCSMPCSWKRKSVLRCKIFLIKALKLDLEFYEIILIILNKESLVLLERGEFGCKLSKVAFFAQPISFKSQ